jgi:photosynthetic reaction center cytochrome c subunit
MRCASRSLTIVSFGAAFAVSVASTNVAQEPSRSSGKTAEQAYKNIQTLKDMPASQLLPAMESMSVALGQTCGFCHVEDLSKDDKEAKQIARKMITMTLAINKDSFAGRPGVGCDTCHRGSTVPIATPSREALARSTKYTRPLEHGEPVESLPTSDQILAKYEEALGGAGALRKVKTRVHVMRRTVQIGAVGEGVMPMEPSGVTDVIRYAKLPDKIIANHSRTDGTFLLWLNGCDGKICWSGENSHTRVPDEVNGLPIADSTYERQARAFHNNYFYGYMPLDLARLKGDYERLEVRDKEQIVHARGPDADVKRDVYFVIGRPRPGDDTLEYLYFDAENGLLLRRTSVGATNPFGPGSQQVDFSDYRDVGDGTKVPFLHLDQHFDEKSREVVTIVQDNVPIDESAFVKPNTTRRYQR